MRTWIRMLVVVAAAGLTTPAAAASKPAKDDFGDLFASKVNKAAAKASAHKAKPAPAKKPQLVAKAAVAAPAPEGGGAAPSQRLVLFDYAPDRHALAGP